MAAPNDETPEIAELRDRLAEAEAALAALREGGVDAVMTAAGLVDLAGAEKPYRIFFEAMNEGGLTLDAEGRILHCNPRFLTLLGRPVEALRGQRFVSYVDVQDRPRVNELLSHKGSGACETTLVISAEARLPVQISFRAMRLDAQCLICLVVTDLSERFQSEAMLRRAAIVFDNSQEGILICDRNNRILQVNPAFCQITGYQRSDVLGEDPKILKSGLHDAAFYEKMWHELIEHKAWRGEIRNRRKSGELLWEFLTINAVFDASGELTYYIAIFSDITELKETGEALKKLNEDLIERIDSAVAKNMLHERMLIQQSRLAALGELVHNISHHWRQPINALTLILANIKDADEYNELTEEYLNQCVADGQRLIQHMSTIIDDFREHFKPDGKKDKFLVDEVAKDAIALVEERFKYQNIEIVQEARDEIIAAFGYPHEFAQVVVYILNNARDAIVATGRGGKVSIQIEGCLESTTLTIRDDGGGLPQRVLEKAFDPYFTTRELGTGLGLYMSRMILEKMGCHIEIHNVDGGAEVRIDLPLVEGENVAQENHIRSGTA